jgi:hypothetical protein
MEELELNEAQTRVSELILETPAPAKHSARSAISHIKKAWKLKATDPEMAVFRAITAEEESVTTIFHSLKRLRYENSLKLKPWNHVHKSALQPFLAAIENNFYAAQMDQFNLVVELDQNETPKRFKTRATVMSESGEQFFVYPIPPLNFIIKQNGKICNFADELLQLTNQKTITKVIDHVKTLANRRNQLLYASQQGIPEVRDLPDSFFLERRDRIFRNLVLFLLIDPYPIQLFIQQALNAFLEVLGLLPTDLESRSDC